MKSRGFDRYVLSVSAALAMLGACSALRQAQDDTEPPIAAPDSGPSWMAPNAKTQNLLYISDGGANEVYVYSYRAGKLVGKLKGLQNPAGVCANAAGDVWIVNSASSKIVEYAHGGTEPKATLGDSAATYLLGCSVDPTTGNLAVTDLGDASVGGSVLIYAGAHGVPKKHRISHLLYVYFCGYDDAGDLFVDGLDGSYTFQFAELPAESKFFKHITLNQRVGFPGGIEWTGQYVAIGDQEYENKHSSAIYQVLVSGSNGTIEGTTALEDSCDVLEFAISSAGSGTKRRRGAEAIAPDACRNNVQFYRYPAGGRPTETLRRFQYPVGAAISLAN
jgi:hypothetical protein